MINGDSAYLSGNQFSAVRAAVPNGVEIEFQVLHRRYGFE